MSSSFLWKGRTTGARYEYDRSTIPSLLIDSQGSLLDGVFFNGEILVLANSDMSVALPTAKGPPVGSDIHAAYVQFPTWDSSAPPSSQGGGQSLPFALPAPLAFR